jgi:hypothetical protein
MCNDDSDATAARAIKKSNEFFVRQGNLRMGVPYRANRWLVNVRDVFNTDYSPREIPVVTSGAAGNQVLPSNNNLPNVRTGTEDP